MKTFAMLLAMTLGIMGILTPYATGPSGDYAAATSRRRTTGA